MGNRRLKRRMEMEQFECELTPQMPIPRDDRLSAIVPIDRICVENEVLGTATHESLFESVKQNGVLQPLLLRRISEEDSSFGGLYLLIAGKKRLAAAKAAGHRAVPCYIVSMGPKDAAVSAFLTDLERTDQDMFAVSDTIFDLKQRFGMTVSEIAKRIGRSESYVAGKMVLQMYSDKERAYLRMNNITEEMALVLLQIKDKEKRMWATKQVCEKKMNVVSALDYVQTILNGSLPHKKNAIRDLGLFYNSIDRLMTALRRSGADAVLEQSETAEEAVVTIRVKKQA